MAYGNLQGSLEGLQQQASLLREKLDDLNASRIIESDASKLFTIKKKIEEAEQELNQINQQFQKYESERFYRTLIGLGYKKHTRLFREFLEENRLGAFLIYGSYECAEFAQQWLLKKLMQLDVIPPLLSTPLIVFPVNRATQRKGIDDLWRQFGNRIGVRSNPLDQVPRDAIIQEVIQRLEKQNIILIIRNIEEVNEQYLNDLILKFWSPLAMKTADHQEWNSPYKLLLFLIGYDDLISEWSVEAVEEYESNWQPQIPVKLPIVDRFSDEELLNWLENEENLPVFLTRQMRHTVNNIFQDSQDGIPERVIAAICKRCGHEWLIEEWLEL